MQRRCALLPFLLLLCSAAFFAPSCMRHTSLTVLQPAEMKLPDHISRVAVIDRSKPSKGWVSILEGIVTGEAIGQDKRSREEAVSGLTNILTRTPRFRVIGTGVEMTGSKGGVNLPEPLEWSQIEKICMDYGADAVVAIESFDSNNSSSARRVESKSKDKSGKEIINVHYDANQRTSVRMGWRMYDPKQKVILDEFVTDDYLEKTATGSTERAALSNLPSQVNVTRDVGYIAGKHYGMRIAPVYVEVDRNYYGKAKHYKAQFKQAARFASSDNWDKAAEIWKRIEATATENKKARGRAAYNMAVASELKGNLDLALEWAQKGWTAYGNKQARNYVSVIKRRQNDARKVDYQMNKKV